EEPLVKIRVAQRCRDRPTRTAAPLSCAESRQNPLVSRKWSDLWKGVLNLSIRAAGQLPRHEVGCRRLRLQVGRLRLFDIPRDRLWREEAFLSERFRRAPDAGDVCVARE